MTPALVALLAFAAMAAGLGLGRRLRRALPDHHLSDESKDAIRIGMALIASLTALVLGLVIASAKSAFDEQDRASRRSAADVLMLDRVLADYGPEAATCREGIRRLVDAQLDRMSGDPSRLTASELLATTFAVEGIDTELRRLTPSADGQRELQSRALKLSSDIQEARWMRLEAASRVPVAFLVIVVLWLTVLFWSFGLFAPPNTTVRTVYLVCALSAAAAIFLILELEHPFGGIVRVSSEPLQFVRAHLGE